MLRNYKISVFVPLIILLIFNFKANSQNTGINTTNPDQSAILELYSTDQGLLIPRMTISERNSIDLSGSPEGCLIYQTNNSPGFYYFTGFSWVPLSSGTDDQNISGSGLSGNILTIGIENGLSETVDLSSLGGGSSEWTDNGSYLFANENNNIRAYEDNNDYGYYYTGTADKGGYFKATQTNADDYGVHGICDNTDYYGFGGYFTGGYSGVYGKVEPSGTHHYYGVRGYASGGSGVNYGVHGTSNGSGENIGVYGTVSENDGFGVYAVNADISGTGLIASGNSVTANYLTNGSGVAGTGSTAGIYGKALNSTGSGILGIVNILDGFGVRGKNDNDSGTGIFGIGNGLTGTYLTAGTGGAFTGENGSFSLGKNVTGGTGAIGVGNDNAMIYTLNDGSGGAFTGTYTGVYGVGTDINSAGGYFESDDGFDYAYVSYYNAGSYKINGTGTVSTIVKDTEGNNVNMFAPESPEVLFKDNGQGKLKNGETYIKLDPVFANNIVVNEEHPLRVMVQPEGNCKGVYVTDKSIDGFKVKELQNGKTDIPFTWFVVANRKDEVRTRRDGTKKVSRYSTLRFPDAPKRMDKESLNKSKIKKEFESKYRREKKDNKSIDK